MFKNIALAVAGIIFGLVAVGHLLRIIYLPELIIAGYPIPLFYNMIGFIIALILCIWMFSAICCGKCRGKKDNKDYFSETKVRAKDHQFVIENSLKGLKVAILLTDGFEQVEMTAPKKALEAAGAKVSLVSPSKNKVRGWQHTDWGNSFKVDVQLDHASHQDFQALLLPGGVLNPDKLRLIPRAIEFIKHFHENNKPIAAICHGPWTLINAGIVQGGKLTSWPSIKTDLINAGANWVDEEVVRDGKLVTSRKPDDIPAFNVEMIRVFSEK